MNKAKKLFSTFVLAISLVSCIGGGGGGGGGGNSDNDSSNNDSGDSSSSQVGSGAFYVSAGPTGAEETCFGHTAGTLESTQCEAIGGTHNSSSLSTCNATGSADNCDYGTAATVCKIGTTVLALDEETTYGQNAVDSCEALSGQVITYCVGIDDETDCNTAGGSWSTQTVHTCTGYDISEQSDCESAGGVHRPEARVLTGNLAGYPPAGIIKGKNKIYISVADDGSEPSIVSFTSDFSILAGSETHWTATITFTPDGEFYTVANGDIYFDVTSPVAAAEADTDNDDSVDAYTSFGDATLLID